MLHDPTRLSGESPNRTGLLRIVGVGLEGGYVSFSWIRIDIS